MKIAVRRPWSSGLLLIAAALGIGLALLAAGLFLAGYDAPAALGAMWQGAFGSWDTVASALLTRSVPLIIIGLALALAFRAGALNIGAEGQFYAGAIAATWVGLHVGAWPAALAIPAVWVGALLAGLLWASVPALLRYRFGVLEVISTLLLNFVAEALVSLMVQGPLQEARRSYPQSDLIALSARLPQLPGTRLHLGFLLAILLALVLGVAFRRTLWGFQLQATGLGPRAAEVTGRIPVRRVLAISLILSGAIAGLAGGVEIGGVSYALFQNLSPGYGFTGIAVALLARLDPIAVIGTGLLFAALEAGAGAMQREASVPSVVVYVVEAVIIVVVLLADQLARRSRAASVVEES